MCDHCHGIICQTLLHGQSRLSRTIVPQGTTSQVTSSARLPINVVDDLHEIGDSQFAPVKLSSLIGATFPYVMLIGRLSEYSASLTDTPPLLNFENQSDTEFCLLFPL